MVHISVEVAYPLTQQCARSHPPKADAWPRPLELSTNSPHLQDRLTRVRNLKQIDRRHTRCLRSHRCRLTRRTEVINRHHRIWQTHRQRLQPHQLPNPECTFTTAGLDASTHTQLRRAAKPEFNQTSCHTRAEPVHPHECEAAGTSERASLGRGSGRP